jgi:hypothetical protein
MRRALGLAFILLAAGCSSGDPAGRQPESRADDASGPNVAVTAAPGVAFNYDYTFRLAAERIGPLQEQHAQACEKLGIARCRITGLHFQRNGEREVAGQLAFKLDPAIARAFGREGVGAVVRADGQLVESTITGEDVGTAIAASERGESGQAEDQKRIEAQLARPGLSGAERAQLQAQTQKIRDEIRAGAESRGEKQAMLATTPVVFNYASGDLVPGFERPFHRAWREAGGNLVASLAWIVLALVTLIPWALLLLLGLWAWRRAKPHLERLGTTKRPPEA